MRAIVFAAILLACMLEAPSSPRAGAAAPLPFPDVPPWHWAHAAVQRDQDAGLIVGYPSGPAELAANAVTQVYDGFAHAGATGAQEWVERFTYNRPPSWPVPLSRSQIVRFVLSGMAVIVRQDAATAAFTASVTNRQGQTATSPMRVALRYNGEDWQVDFNTLTAGSPVFR